ncbi:hypothetical protein O6H91_22G014800 [Diphasiastrum complanatum]|uniref:Uncharacterized protein n=1 Tax=Diphasiastrum complanatum TaxID=34168 RepID=A0ACC2ADF6_DIPCM|nr:hypothetical protein O6H91_Y416500 [Diphasiastrum complanatum]KAJ7515481.1 hypothetical protein O6H91_22G014800 [Diphasiastrum complanatum]
MACFPRNLISKYSRSLQSAFFPSKIFASAYYYTDKEEESGAQLQHGFTNRPRVCSESDEFSVKGKRRETSEKAYSVKQIYCNDRLGVAGLFHSGRGILLYRKLDRGCDWKRVKPSTRSFVSEPVNEEYVEAINCYSDKKHRENGNASCAGGISKKTVQAEDPGTEDDKEDYNSEEEEDGEVVSELEEGLRALQAADPDDPRIGIASLRLAQEYDLIDEDPEKILHHAQQALKIFGVVNDDSLHLGMSLHLIGTAYFKLGKLEVSLDNLKRALLFFEKKEQQGKHVDPFKYAVLSQMGSTNVALGKHSEAVQNFCDGLEIQEALLEHDDPQLASSFRRAAEACSDALRFSEAQHLMERAVQIHKLSYGEASLEEARDRQLLSVIFVGLNEHEKALEQLQISRKFFIQNNVDEVSALDISIADAQISLERYEDSIATLLAVIKQIPENDPIRAMVHVNLAKSYYQQKKVDEAKQHCGVAHEIFTSCGDTDLLAAGKGLVELASVHETMNELEKSIEVLKQALTLFEQTSDELDEVADAQAHIGMQLFFLGKLEEGLPYLERSVEQLQNIFGKQHQTVARVLNQIGVAHLELEKYSAAVDFLERAKVIMSNTSGQGHPDTLSVIHNLVNAYAAVGRLRLVKYESI